MILLDDNISKTRRVWRIVDEERDALGIIMSNKGHQIEIENTTPLMDDLEI